MLASIFTQLHIQKNQNTFVATILLLSLVYSTGILYNASNSMNVETTEASLSKAGITQWLFTLPVQKEV